MSEGMGSVDAFQNTTCTLLIHPSSRYLLSRIIEPNLRFQRRVSATIDFGQYTLLPLRFFMISCQPSLNFGAITPVADELIAVTNLMQLCPRRLRVLGEGDVVFYRTYTSLY